MPQEEKTPVSVDLPIEFLIPDHIKTKLANMFTVQQVDGGFFILFYEMMPPIFIGEQEQFFELASSGKTAKAECVSRLFIPSTRIESFIDTLKDQLAVHLQMNASGKQPVPPKVGKK
jgi:hypothetical protein